MPAVCGLNDRLVRGQCREVGDGSPETVDRVAQALVAYDAPAYRTAMLEVITQAMTLTLDRIDNVEVTGDTATADVTTTQTMGDNPPQTDTDSIPYVREAGRWLDCSDPTGGF